MSDSKEVFDGWQSEVSTEGKTTVDISDASFTVGKLSTDKLKKREESHTFEFSMPEARYNKLKAKCEEKGLDFEQTLGMLVLHELLEEESCCEECDV